MTVEVSDELMRAAFERKLRAVLEKDADSVWPRAYELAMTSPIYSRLVYIEALHGEISKVHFRPDNRKGLAAGFHRGDSTTRYWWQDRD